MNEEREYIAFISYRHTPLDQKAARRIRKSIESFTVPKEFREQMGGKRMGMVFRDEDELTASASLSDSIMEALDHTQYLIVICTPDLPKSPWCEKEIRYFLETHDRDHLLAVLADGSPDESFSPYMMHTYDEEGRITGDVEPLAANIAGKDHSIDNRRYRKEFIRLCAAMIGCPFDALWQRERRARANTLAGITAGAFLIMAVFLSTVLLKNRQITKQNRQIQSQNDFITEQNDQITKQNGQITQQNEELEAQKLELEQRVSKALVETGQTKLENYDEKGALEDALAAAENDDPSIMDPRTVKLLSDALHVYSKNVFHTEVVYEQANDILDLQISDDGRRIVLLDSAGTIRCLYAEDYTVSWEIRTGDTKTFLYLKNQQDRMLYKNRNQLVCLSLEDGSLLWEYDLAVPNHFQALSGDGTCFAVMDRIGEESYSGNNPVHVIFLQTEDGSEIARGNLDVEGFRELLDDFYESAELAGSFSQNGEWFFCSVNEKDEEDESDTRSFAWLVNTKTGACRTVYNMDHPDFYFGAYVDNEGSEVLYACHSLKYGGILYGLKKQDEEGSFSAVQAPELLSQDVNSPDGGITMMYEYMNEVRTYTMLPSDMVTVICHDNRLILLDTQNSKIIKSLSVTGGIRSIRWLDEERTSFTFVTSEGLVETIQMPDPSEGHWYKRILNANLNHSDIVLAATLGDPLYPIGPDQEAVYNMEAVYLTVRKNQPGQILKTCTITDADGAEPGLAKRDMEMCIGMYLLPETDAGFVVLDSRSIAGFDRKSGEETGFMDFGEGSLYGRDWLALDEESLLKDDTVYHLDGSVETYGEPYQGGYTDIYATVHRRLSNGQILSAEPKVFDYIGRYDYTNYNNFSGATLTPVWLDGELIEASANVETGLFLNEVRDVACDLDNYSLRTVSIGGNGQIMQYGKKLSVDGKRLLSTPELCFAVFDALDGTRQFFDDPCQEEELYFAVLGTKEHLLAAVYGSGKVQILHTDTGEFHALDAQYTAGEVISMGFADGDDYLILQTRPGFVDIYETDTWTLVYSEEASRLKTVDSLGSGGTITARILDDPAVMIIDKRFGAGGRGHEMILDLTSWSEVTTLSDVFVMDPENRMFYTNRSFVNNELEITTYPLYDLDRLKEKARERLETYQ